MLEDAGQGCILTPVRFFDFDQNKWGKKYLTEPSSKMG
jgi:hypothetical protein